MNYAADLAKETEKLRRLVATREKLTSNILEQQRRVMALNTLVGGHNTEDLGLALRRGRITDSIRQVLEATDQPLTAGEIVEELIRLGSSINDHANPLASVTAICSRLVGQGFAKEKPDTKPKAWERNRHEDLKRFIRERGL